MKVIKDPEGETTRISRLGWVQMLWQERKLTNLQSTILLEVGDSLNK